MKFLFSIIAVQKKTEIDSFGVISFNTSVIIFRLSLVFVTYNDQLNSNTRSIEVSGLKPATDYVFRVAGRNQAGLGTYSAVHAAHTLDTGLWGFSGRTRLFVMFQRVYVQN